MKNATNASLVFSRSWKLIGPQRKDLPLVLAASIALSIIDTVSVGLFGPFVASIVSPDLVRERAWYQWLASTTGMEAASPVTTIATLLIAVFLVKLVGATLVLRIVFNFCARLDKRLRHQLLERYYSIDLSKLAASSSASFVQAVHGYTAQFAYGLVGTQLRSITELLIGCAILGYLFYLHAAALTLLLLLVGCLIFVYDKVLKKRIHSFGHEAAHLGESLIRSVQQVSNGIREIRVYGVDQRLLARAKNAADRFSELSAKYQWIQSVPKYLIEFSLMVTVCALVLLMQNENLPKEEMFSLMGVFGVAVMRLTPAANYVLNALSQLRFVDFIVDQLSKELLEDMSANAAYKPTQESTKPLQELESIELKDLAFRYNADGQYLLSGVNIHIRKGDSIGLIGPSGGGKTTLAEIMLGLRQPTQGQVLINGALSKEFDEFQKFQHFAYIPQQLFLVEGSLRDNISLLDPAKDVSGRVSAAVVSAQLADFVRGLPDGLETLCGENGAMLSGGQRQRVALARAFYHKRSVLVMDEATSALDYETEREIIREIRTLKGKVTLIVIAHRLETVADCDRIFRVADGKVVAVPRKDIMATSS